MTFHPYLANTRCDDDRLSVHSCARLQLKDMAGDDDKNVPSKDDTNVSGNEDLTTKATSAAKNIGSDIKEAVSNIGKKITGDGEGEGGDAAKEKPEEETKATEKQSEESDTKLGDAAKGTVESAKEKLGLSSSDE